MTTISASVFSGLMGADPALIAWATALINDQRLTSLESLRQNLNDGTWIVRTATAADNMRGNPAIFINPIADGEGNVIQRGQVVLRLEDLTKVNETTALRLVANIVHEGAGHGSSDRVADRELARERLVERHQRSFHDGTRRSIVNAMLDDESGARYTEYKFRVQLAGLNTEYNASNRATLEYDKMFQVFSRYEIVANDLGLSGIDKRDFIVLSAREEMAANDGHLYRDEASQYVLEVLRLNGTQEGAAYLDHVKQSYNAVGYEVIDPVIHDDGSWSASVVYENGNRTDLVFDSTGPLFQRSETVANGDGSTTRTVTSGSGEVLSTSRTQHFDDGSTLTTTTASGGMTLAATDGNGTLAHEGSFVSAGTGDGSSGTLTESIDGRSVVFNATLAADGRLHLDAIASVNGQPPRDAALVNAAFDDLDVDLTSTTGAAKTPAPSTSSSPPPMPPMPTASPPLPAANPAFRPPGTPPPTAPASANPSPASKA